jgi:hypothetical protein
MSLESLTIEADVIGADPLHPDEPVVVQGQHEVAVTSGDVAAVRLVPANPPACPEAIASVHDADYIVLGPGSWFTSVLPHLLVPELAEAIVSSSAHRILTLNIEPEEETKGIGAAQHLEILAEHAPRLRFDAVVADSSFGADDRNLRTFAGVLGAELVVAESALLRRQAPGTILSGWRRCSARSWAVDRRTCARAPFAPPFRPRRLWDDAKVALTQQVENRTGDRACPEARDPRCPNWPPCSGFRAVCMW